MATSTVTTPGAISPEDLRDALRCLTRRWSGLDAPAGNGASKSESTKPSMSSEAESERTSMRAGGLLGPCEAIVGPVDTGSSCQQQPLPPGLSGGDVFTKDPGNIKKLDIPELQSWSKGLNKLKVMAELCSLADEFNGKHKVQIDEMVLAEACAYIQDYSPGIASTLIAEIILPIVGEESTALWQRIGALAVIRAVLQMAPERFRPDETAALTSNAELLANDLLQPVMETGGQSPGSSLLYHRDQHLSAIPEPEQTNIKRSLNDQDDQGKPAWLRFAEINFGARVNECENVDLFWIILREENYTIGKLYGHLIAAGLFRAARRLEAST